MTIIVYKERNHPTLEEVETLLATCSEQPVSYSDEGNSIHIVLDANDSGFNEIRLVFDHYWRKYI